MLNASPSPGPYLAYHSSIVDGGVVAAGAGPKGGFGLKGASKKVQVATRLRTRDPFVLAQH